MHKERNVRLRMCQVEKKWAILIRLDELHRPFRQSSRQGVLIDGAFNQLAAEADNAD